MAPYLDPTNQAVVNAGAKAGGPKLYELSFVEAREALEGAQKHTPATDIVTEEISVTVDVAPGKKSTVKTIIYKPAKGIVGESAGTVFFFHGGGWILGSPKTHDRLVRDLVRESGLPIVFPYYTPAPDAQYPIQFEENYGVLKHVVEHGAEHGLNTGKIAFVGDSVGGNMAIAMSALTAERHGPRPVFQVLFYPVTDTLREFDTYKEFKHGPGLELATLMWMVHAFLPVSDDRAGHIASPLLSHTEQLVRQPPTLLITAGVDPLRTQGEEFAHALQQVGVPTAVFRADGQVHDFVMLNAVATNPTAVATIELAALKLRKALG
ncbi:MAG: hypothetical protein M4579_002911 [Chaenotheca gracillima]|nr:MAG: hypothetical protein M4579_002911 [Chaenotheca gracillima]